MISRATSSLFDSEDVLSKFDRTANQIEWKIYNRQQIDLIIKRLQTASQSSAASIFQRIEKLFHIKTIEQTSALFVENSYVEWILFVRIMKNQFDQNNCDNFASNSNRFKILYVEIFLKKNINAQLLWQAERTSNSDKKYIWVEFKNFLNKNIKRVFTRKKNIYDKYLKYKQNFQQFVMNYDAHRIALKAELTFDLKSNAEIDFQNFVKSLREENKNFLIDHDIENKTTILNRLKSRENREQKKRFNNHNKKLDIIKNKSQDDFNKRKRNNENFDVEKDKINETIKSKNKKNDKRLKFNNSNQESFKKKLWRWIKNEYKNIVDKNKCRDCDKSNCNLNNDCKNKKSEVHFAKMTFDSQTKN